jgi:GTP pyrophosphokinase/guanosine-3',5'-bis(diphosphate) 3'-pyrophosphohydrolase
VGKKATEKALDTAARHMRLTDRRELLARLGSAELTGHDIVQAVYPDLAPDEGDQISPRRAVIGLEPGQSFERAPCCQPLPGERIIGITYRGKGVVVHAADCDNLGKYEEQPERWVDVHWNTGTHPAVYGTTLEMTIGNDAGVLGRICTLIGEKKANISDLEFVDRKPDFYKLMLNVELRDAEQLHSLMLALEAESDVAAVERFRESLPAVTLVR